VEVPSIVLARPRAASPLSEARLVRVGLVHHPVLVDKPQLAKPQVQLRAGVDRLGSGSVIVGLVAQQATTAHHAAEASA
jgi:folate-dependent tRNA-U54 methylase TrmFO/GidA